MIVMQAFEFYMWCIGSVMAGVFISAPVFWFLGAWVRSTGR